MSTPLPSRRSEPPRIESLRHDARGGTWVWIIVAGRRVARVPSVAIEKLSLAEGQLWTPALATQVEFECQVQKARERSVRLLAVRARTKAELVRKLLAGGFKTPVAEAAAESLTAQGLLDDKAIARGIVQRDGLRTAGDAELARRLEARGVTASEAEDALAEALSESRRAHLAAVALSRRIPKDLEPAARWRRMLAGLARRGFADDAAFQATRELLGEPPEEASDAAP